MVPEKIDRDLPLVGASASVTNDEAYITVTNLDCRETHTIDLSLEGMELESETVDAVVLFEDHDPDVAVDADNAAEFAANELVVSIDNGSLLAELPSSTVAGISIH